MNAAFKHSQTTLNMIQRKVRQRLELIQHLDKECLHLELNLEQMREIYLEEANKDNLYAETLNDSTESIRIQDIANLQEELKQLALRKIHIAEEIQSIVSQAVQQVQKQLCQAAEEFTGTINLKQQIKSQHLYQSGLIRQKGRQKNVHPDIKVIIKEYYSQKESQNTVFEADRKYCKCKSDKKLLYPGSMIECEKPSCNIGWYHFECVGIGLNEVPTNWYCQSCLQQDFQEVNKIILENQHEKIEVQIKNQDGLKTPKNMVKRGRGRPRKIKPELGLGNKLV